MLPPQSLSQFACKFVRSPQITSFVPGRPLLESFARQNLTSITTTRHASHATQGRANGPAPGPGKRLGAKRGASELVVPGNIIFRQRGTLWFAGENCVMGRDHTISAIQKGYVRYYRDPERHPTRKYIGVVFEQDETLPRGRNAARKRRLGMDAVVMEAPKDDEGNALQEKILLEGVGDTVVKEKAKGAIPGVRSLLTLSAGYQYRESNTEIGRAAERAGIHVKPFKPRSRWVAWRLRNKSKERAAEKRSLKRKK